MRIFINEKSLPEKTGDADAVRTALEHLVRISERAKLICNNHPIRRHRELKQREVMPGVSLGQFILELEKHRDPRQRTLKGIFLRIFANGPFFEGFHSTGTVTNDVGECLKDSCFDDAVASRTGAAVISASSFSSNDVITIISSQFGTRKILNLNSIAQVEQHTWIYQSNPKHDLSKNRIVAGETYSAMTLTDAEAQNLLTNGVKCGRSIFNKLGDQWYKFHCHEKNLYHGFPISVRTPYREYSNACQIVGNLKNNSEGQIFTEYLGD